MRSCAREDILLGAILLPVATSAFTAFGLSEDKPQKQENHHSAAPVQAGGSNNNPHYKAIAITVLVLRSKVSQTSELDT